MKVKCLFKNEAWVKKMYQNVQKKVFTKFLNALVAAFLEAGQFCGLLVKAFYNPVLIFPAPGKKGFGDDRSNGI